MNHLIMTLPFIMYSLAIVFLLAHTDPRRRQLSNKTDNTTNRKFVLSVAGRKLLAWSLILPFIPLAAMANYAGILMYAGAVTVIGWAVSELPTSVV
ncbi:hypothetical protein [Aliiglaciecola lipolytica]|uniref:Uncharacterized protein n=1 Tax=Aliiglaciecola lipolytica E3 TaxID=1127673 RepID=K6XQH5_9ALTE|nr:hypothetical protein [Aliiglaciecola lipolytica]GAC13936.1 hypothetical protein GLIP_1295 [Aliiglaciecola lipolytica E3]